MIAYENRIPHSHDITNHSRKRNLRNTPRNYFNCAGYALGSFNWYMPVEDENLHSRYYQNNEEACIEHILNTFHDTRLINSISELNDNEYCVAFRTAKQDFHFMKRARNGIWFAKMGRDREILRYTESQVFDDVWYSMWGDYDGQIYLFAKLLP